MNQISARCRCGEVYRLSPEMNGIWLRCRSCQTELQVGGETEAEEVPEIRFQLTADLAVKDPDELLRGVQVSILPRALAFSLVFHLVFVGLTSFSLYEDWQEFGFLMPQEIRVKKSEKAEVERKKEMDRIQAEKEKSATTDESSPGVPPAVTTQPQTADPATPPAAVGESGGKSSYQEKVEEVVKDKPENSAVSLDSDLGLEE